MERDGWPERFRILTTVDVLGALGGFALSQLSILPSRVLSPISDHFQRDSGASEMLDANLDYEKYQQQNWDFEE